MLRRHLLILCALLASASFVIWSHGSTESAVQPNAAEDDDEFLAFAPEVEIGDESAVEDDDPLPAKPAGKNARKLTPQQTTATHKQARVIQPMHDGKPVSLATFCLGRNGNILACVADNSGAFPGQHSRAGNSKVGSYVQEYAFDGKLLKEIPVGFHVTAINIGPKDDVFIAGAGKMARIVDGIVTGEAPTPQIGDYEAFKKQVAKTAENETAEYRKMFDEQISSLKKQVETLEAKAKKEELTKREEAKLKSTQQALKMQEQQIEAIVGQMGDPEVMARQRMVVTALGVTSEDVFVSVMSTKGHGYEVWRTDYDFKEPKKVVSSLSGCCGQLDIQARDDRLYIAENGKFEVSVRDRDGKRLSGFGRRDRSAADGFGSCCNPMNVRCCNNGDILAAESSIGNIKRFNAKGEFVSLVGKAKIGIGCKHVALAYDESRDRYYMMNVDKAHIAVLIPVGEVPPESEAEKAARIARDEFSKTLVGKWERDGREQKKKPAKSALNGLIGSLFGGSDDEGPGMAMPEQPFDAVTFSANGGIQVEGGMLGMYARGNELSWEAVALTGKALDVAFNMDGAEFINGRIEKQSDDEIEIRSQNFGSGNFGKPFKFKRIKPAEKPQPEKTR